MPERPAVLVLLQEATTQWAVPCLSSIDTARALASSAAFPADLLDVRRIEEWRGSREIDGSILLEFPLQLAASGLSLEESV